MTNFIRVVGLLGMGLAIAACGDDDDQPAAQAATVDPATAKASANATVSALSTTLSADEKGDSAGSLAAVAQSSSSMLTPSAGGTGTKSVKSGLDIASGGLQIQTLGGGPGCACTGTSCTFSACSIGATTANASTSITMDGSYSWTGGHILCSNLKYTVKADLSGGTGQFSSDSTITMNCDITVTSTSINGYLQTTGSSTANIAGQSQQENVSENWDVKSTYNNVTFDGTTHQATGGSVHVQGSLSVNANGNAASFAGSADVTLP